MSHRSLALIDIPILNGPIKKAFELWHPVMISHNKDITHFMCDNLYVCLRYLYKNNLEQNKLICTPLLYKLKIKYRVMCTMNAQLQLTTSDFKMFLISGIA